jgi:hypothetical protein
MIPRMTAARKANERTAIVAVMMPVISIASLLSGAVGVALDPLHYLPDRHQEDEGWKDCVNSHGELGSQRPL